MNNLVPSKHSKVRTIPGIKALVPLPGAFLLEQGVTTEDLHPGEMSPWCWHEVGLGGFTEEGWLPWLGMSASALFPCFSKPPPISLAAPALARLHYDCDITPTRTNLAHRLQSIMEESQGKNLEAGSRTEAETREEHVLLACSVWFLFFF